MKLWKKVAALALIAGLCCTVAACDLGMGAPDTSTPEQPSTWEDDTFYYYRTATDLFVEDLKNKSVTEIVIPDGVTGIGYNAFAGEAITSATIPDSVTSIGEGAFGGCTSLTSVTIGDSVTSIGGSAFQDCSSLTSVTIPDSVTSIGYGAFDGCTSLTSVYYHGTASEWNCISIVPDNWCLTDATWYYYSESAPTTEGNFWHYVDGVPTAW